VGIGKNQYGQTYNFNQCTYSTPNVFFLFLRASHTILTSDPAAKYDKEELDLRTLLFSWFLCPVLYGNLSTVFEVCDVGRGNLAIRMLLALKKN
jgi:hypothetical protein